MKVTDSDETLIGGYSKGKISSIGNINLLQIEDFKKAIFKQAVEKMVDTNATITTDEFPSWEALKKDSPNLKTKKSEKGKAFKEMHEQIMLVKMWLRGIHHKYSEKFLQGYLDEYTFRFNNRNQSNKIFDGLVCRMMSVKPQPFKRTKRVCACNI